MYYTMYYTMYQVLYYVLYYVVCCVYSFDVLTLTPLELVLLRTIFLNRPVSNCWPCPGVDMTKPKTWHKLVHAFPRLGRTFIPLLK